MECELCKLKPITKCYYEDDNWKIIDCDSCSGIVVVFKHHLMIVYLKDLNFILNKIDSIFGNVIIRTKQRKIKDHFHFHIYNDKI